MRIQLSDHFTYSRLIRFTFPSIIMMIFTSIYSVVDGLFFDICGNGTACVCPHCLLRISCRWSRNW